MIKLLLAANLVTMSVNSNVYTPNGSSVAVTQFSELSTTVINYYNTQGDALFSNDIRLSSSTKKYNCHSYAWYSQNARTNQYWMNEPDYIMKMVVMLKYSRLKFK